MKKLIFQILKIIFIVLACVLAAVGSYALVTYMSWPWWAGACLFGGIMGLVISVLFIRKWFLRHRERKFVKRIVDQDDSVIAAAPTHERARLQELQDRWMAAVELLSNSQLRKRGNPLYVLPWYMIFGESESGKTTAVTNSRLTTILTDVGPVPGVSATKNCDWWFFEEAVIIDTAGRYAIPLDESRDKEEWVKFLTLLGKFRKKEPLNGLIITVPADRLLEGDEDSLGKYGRSLRRRINELMRMLGVRFPVYVLVTKIDLVFGLKGLVEVLPDYTHSQAMGLVNEAMINDPEAFVDKTIESVTGRLRELRLLLLDDAGRFDPAFLLFSDELNRLRPKFKAFAAGAFEDNPYQEQPLFRGMFFSSGEQTGEQNSSFINELESLKVVAKKLPETNEGLFLHDFFSKVLPRDRNLFTPILEFLKWKLFTRNLGMAVWLVLLFFVSIFFSMSYIGNQRAMNEIFASFPHKPVFSKHIDEHIVEMDAFREKIDQLHVLNSDWWVPRVGLDVSRDAEQVIKKFYCESFKSSILEPMDMELNTAINKLDTKSADQLTSDFIKLLVWRIDLLNTRLNNKSMKQFSAFELPSGKAMTDAVKGFNPDLMKYWGATYNSYLEWTSDSESLYEQKLLLQARLGRVFSLKGADFRWLVNWVNDNPALVPVTLQDFWGGPHLQYENEVSVVPSYTVKGREMLQAFLAELKQAMQDSGEFDKREKAFWIWYAGEYYKEWFNFAEHYAEGEGQLLTKVDYQDMAMKMSLPDNPYFALLTRMKDEFNPIKNITKRPEWVDQVFHFNIILSQYKASKAKGVEESSEKAEDSLRKAVANLGGKMALDIEKRIEVAKHLDAYISVLGDVAAYTTSQETAFKSAAALFPATSSMTGSSQSAASGAPGVKKDPVNAAVQAMKSLKAHMDSEGQGSNTFWNLLAGPLDFIVYVVIREASCELQVLWEGQVLAETAHVPSDKLRTTLFGKTGVVKKFISGSAKPFLLRDVKGWGSRKWFDMPFPFREEFFAFIDDGAQGGQEIQPEYKVKLSTIPTSVNANATEEPYATLLTVECGSAQQTLSNYNYSEEAVFTWKPEECGTTTLRIQFPGLELVKTYEGKLGFAKFLGEFRNGVVNYTPADFPEQSKGISSMGISTIKVGYTLNGATPVINLLNLKPINIPDVITDCWQH
ncbi:type VI secretion protein IcmF/TssM N-terminal domain-containing protein [Maridesulfovibrio zosterae]|uniref:type VI secretion protein IcmF/TssM N-terminal domain-containing protein n=1 Tax=Maridesulfovibrio zosterae TaxID=82171 RepID=UPI00040EB4A6|nr:type VI secretion protein IcmF/TssM N-terminal domain-containing protein [Maridesulfovibrio zosterae]